MSFSLTSALTGELLTFFERFQANTAALSRHTLLLTIASFSNYFFMKTISLCVTVKHYFASLKSYTLVLLTFSSKNTIKLCLNIQEFRFALHGNKKVLIYFCQVTFRLQTELYKETFSSMFFL